MRRILGCFLLLGLLFAVLPMNAKAEDSLWTNKSVPKELAEWENEASILQLKNGKILFIGAKGAFSYLYDPEQNTVGKLPGINQPGLVYNPLELSDGRVMIFSGTNYALPQNKIKSIRRAEIYDFSKKKWSSTGLMKEVRQIEKAYLIPNFSVTLLSDDRVLVSGGRINDYEALKTSEIYDPKKNTWSSTRSKMSVQPLYGLNGTLLQDGKVFYTLSNEYGSFYEVYDPKKDQWSLGSEIPLTLYNEIKNDFNMGTASELYQGVLLDSGKVLVITDTGIYLYSPDNDHWTDLGYVPYPKDNYSLEQYQFTPLQNGLVLITALEIEHRQALKVKQQRLLLFDSKSEKISRLVAPLSQNLPLLFPIADDKVLAIGSNKYERLSINWSLNKFSVLKLDKVIKKELLSK